MIYSDIDDLDDVMGCCLLTELQLSIDDYWWLHCSDDYLVATEEQMAFFSIR